MVSISPEVDSHSSGQSALRGVTEDEEEGRKEAEAPPWKRADPPFPSKEEAVAYFYDSLSKLPLTRRALREFNRRNEAKAGLAPTATSVCSPNQNGRVTVPKNSSPGLRRFARQGGPDLSDLRWCSAKEIPSSHSPSKTSTASKMSTMKTSCRKTSAYHSEFQVHLIDHGIYPDGYALNGQYLPGPSNESEIRDIFARPRPSLSESHFTEEDFLAFKAKNRQATNEPMVMQKPFSVILGSDVGIQSGSQIPFSNLKVLTNGTLVEGNPDHFDGAPRAQIAPQIREELGSYICPSTNWLDPALPNFFTEGKGPSGSAVVGERQACYDGVLGARGMHQLRTFATENTYDGNAYTITSTYCSSGAGTLRIFASRPIPSTNPNSRLCDYHTCELGAWVLTSTRKQFCEGVAAFRNARDWAKEQRDVVIAAANARLSQMNGHAHTQPQTGLADGRPKPRRKRQCGEGSPNRAEPQPKRRRKG
ncbi:MAG: hypothetical protein M1816_003581 [Peltula sp. TS41687]|nr:MAG: hypothetical protein M1816_003581 [Peltula sp. TS41687]